MAPTTSLASALGLVALGARTAMAVCQSYGIDFQHGGKYFQNSLSSDDFTFVSQFEGCRNDTAENILVDPKGNQSLCSQTPLTPDNEDTSSTCPIKKSQLFDGPWSIVIISKNGDGEPIAYERDFSITVGPQSTSTYTPTATATVVTTPVVTMTSTTTSTTTSVLSASTITGPSVTATPTTTETPAEVTTTSTQVLLSLVVTAYDLHILKTTVTKTASCSSPTRAARDPAAHIKPTIGPFFMAASAKYSREILEEEKRRFVEARALRLAERAPDPQPFVVTDANTAHWSTVTTTSTADATTATITTEVTTTVTSTPPAVTVLTGESTAPWVTVTADTPTKTKTQYIIPMTTITKTQQYAFIITTTTTPASVQSACKAAGGMLF
ncbi:hypothetical protein BU26DRAFT_565441 [Trematosphaeria pertusa]|uniref:Lytic polysaccharide monooxygenase n=1 Tax=Trematosphaeria pertusa TaxID=390896 RepID=A0A6A6IDR0_9PLEO|nr:uncharacterized protein BU26DRAFT_565441 [Trematosphaeria pertusa]KAF2248022.1 hypothetical protein BU26DRAFT_565441 [Trematosphaeria pertusa]